MSRHRGSIAAICCLVTATLIWALLATAHPQDPVPVGGELQVNTHTPSSQLLPTVAVDGDGNYVIVWDTYVLGVDDNVTDVRGRCYAADGTPLGDDFLINSYTTSWQNYSSIDRAPNGEFVVVWQSEGSYGTDTDRTSVIAQRFAADCTPIGAQIQVNDYTTDHQGFPTVAMNPEGGFIVTWTGASADGGGIIGRRFAADGTPLGDEFRIDDAGIGFFQRMAAAPDGGFLVTWGSHSSVGDDSSYSSAQARRYGPDGEPLGDQFQVNSYTTGHQSGPLAAFDADGSFLVVWNSAPAPGDPTNQFIIGQRFDPQGEPVGPEVQLAAFTDRSGATSVTATEDGGFVVVWQGFDPAGDDTDAWSSQGLRLDSAGLPVGGRFQLNTYTTSYQNLPNVAPVPDGFIVAWNSLGSAESDDSESSIQARRFVLPLFHDGFESGDLTAWSATEP